ncbi:hypothetical protein [Desulfogranum mediterraneum]|uniref:hypothetical protein n=1 Tax=Desulfogranum mediterraneum TaxID=160661 RepID=UPI00040BAD05|nr:hypothetical protein [Desulfogranum mediterraneum]
MYLAQKNSPRGMRYILRESFRQGEVFSSRDLLDLGHDPGRFIVYSGDISYQLDKELLASLAEQGVDGDDARLEELFFPFVDPYIRYKLEPFRHRHAYRRWQPMADEERLRVVESTHVFDRRRLHFLRFGQSTPETLDRSAPLYRVLLAKSRDEIEQLVLEREKELQPREYKNYLFTIFDLQRFFQSSLARHMVHALDPVKVDEFLLQEYCALDQSQAFWAGYERSQQVPWYLLRYLLMYFDQADEAELLWSSRGQRFRRSRRASAQSPPPARPRMSLAKAAEIFGLSRGQLAAMGRKELTSLYRQKAHTMHPDKGGSHDQFVELTSAYDELLRARP